MSGPRAIGSFGNYLPGFPAAILNLFILLSLLSSMDNMRTYIDSLGGDVSPNTGSDLPSRALRCLFALSESSGSRAERLAMVGGAFGPIPDGKEAADSDEGRSDGGKGGGSSGEEDEARALIPALLAFLGRCPRDSSEQYLVSVPCGIGIALSALSLLSQCR